MPMRRAVRGLDAYDLVWCSGTIRDAPFEVTARAAAAAGFQGVSIYYDEYRAALAAGWPVHIEYSPRSGISRFATACEIVRRAERPNGGVLVDSWHHLTDPAPAAPASALDPFVAARAAYQSLRRVSADTRTSRTRDLKTSLLTRRAQNAPPEGDPSSMLAPRSVEHGLDASQPPRPRAHGRDPPVLRIRTRHDRWREGS
jgi:hypothetical protein